MGEQVIEVWTTISLLPCATCQALNGRMWPRGEGPQPVIDTHPHCRCMRVAISGRFSGRRRERQGKSRLPRRAGSNG